MTFIAALFIILKIVIYKTVLRDGCIMKIIIKSNPLSALSHKVMSTKPLDNPVHPHFTEPQNRFPWPCPALPCPEVMEIDSCILLCPTPKAILQALRNNNQGDVLNKGMFTICRTKKDPESLYD